MRPFSFLRTFYTKNIAIRVSSRKLPQRTHEQILAELGVR